MVVDSDETPSHDHPDPTVAVENAACRLCQLRLVVARESARLSAVPNRDRLKFAIGLAVPAIEAWYRCGVDPHVNEATWIRKLQGERVSYDKASLKRQSYGSDRAPLSVRIERANDAAERLTSDLDLLERLFPNGFGSLRRDLQDWR